MDENTVNLDAEYKRYLQIMRPYLGQLVDEDAIYICNSWIKRLSNCSESEKPMRNRYIFVLCYQLATGILDVPFLNSPPNEELAPIPEVMDSDSSSETVECTTEADDEKTRIIYKKSLLTETDLLSQGNEFEQGDSIRDSESKAPTITHEKKGEATRQQTVICYTCPKMMRACADEVRDVNQDHEFRANNLILRLREIKKQNMLLHNELVALKEESKERTIDKTNSRPKVNRSTSAFQNTSCTSTQHSMRLKLQDAEEDKQNMVETIASLQEQLDHFYELKRLEMEDLEANHKLEIIKLKTSLRDESKDMYDDKLEELKKYYEDLIDNMKQNHSLEVNNMKKLFDETINVKEKTIQENAKSLEDKIKEVQEKNEEIQKQDKKVLELNTILHERDKTIEAKDHIIVERDKEIANLKGKIDDQTNNLQTILGKFLDKPNLEVTSDSSKLKAQELEKRLHKMEKSKAKCIKIFEGKLAYLQREKHLAECSLQLQLVRQRAQVVNEIVDDNQSELAEALDKLEAKYKDIVANVQSAAIQRRMQDQIALDAVLQSACGLRTEITANQTLSAPIRPKDENQSYESEISGLIRSKMNANKSYGEESVPTGYCLNGERFGELFDKIHIPQRDLGDVALKK